MYHNSNTENTSDAKLYLLVGRWCPTNDDFSQYLYSVGSGEA